MNETENEGNFESQAHEMLSGITVAMLIEAIGAIPVVDVDGRHTPYADVMLPDEIPFPVRSVRIRVEAPVGEFSMLDFLSGLATHGNPGVREVVERAIGLIESEEEDQ